MQLTKQHIRSAQSILNEHFGCQLAVDGIKGPNTIDATNNISEVQANPSWSDERKIVATIQTGIKLKGFEPGPIDGFWGQQTQTGYDQMNGQFTDWRDGEGDGAGDGTWPKQSTSSLTRFYGEPGTNQGKVVSPYPLRIAWDVDTVVTKFTCHEKLVVPIRNVLERAQDFYGDQITSLGLDLWGGCYNKRKMRGGTQWSTHSWGIAIDWDPARNQLKWGKDKANFANPIYDRWWELWEEEKFTSLGRAKNYDWMHIQAANVG